MRTGESVCETPFRTPSRERAVASHYLRGAAEMQLSYGYFLCAYLPRPTKTNHPFLFSLSMTSHMRVTPLLFPFSP